MKNSKVFSFLSRFDTLKKFGLFVVFVFLSYLSGCSKTQPVISSVFTDNFNRDNIGKLYRDTIGRYLIIHGAVNVRGAYNHPMWLLRPVPVNIDLDLDVWTRTSTGDIKIELFGDGKSFALNRGAYVASGYVFCQGGWNNSKTFIAKRFEHAKNLLYTKKIKAEKNIKYHWKIRSRLKKGVLVLTWFINGKQALELKDKKPLYGENNRYFGFNNWSSDVYFDNLKITPVSN